MSKVVAVNCTIGVLDLLESVLKQYDVVFVETIEGAYSKIKSVCPNLVVFCLDFEDLNGFHILSALRLNPETQNIPFISIMSEDDGKDGSEISGTVQETDLFSTEKAERPIN